MTIINGRAKTAAAAATLLTKLINTIQWEELTHEERILADDLLQILYDHMKEMGKD